MRSARLLVSLIAIAPAPVAAQELSPLDPTAWGVVYDVPGTRDVELRTNVPYGTSAGRTLRVDIYRPAGMRADERRPAVVFINAVGDIPGSERGVKDWEIYRSWPRLVAAHGLIGVSMDADPVNIDGSLRSVFAFLARDGAQHGIDSARLGVYAASANATGASRLLLNDSAPAGVKAAVLYYGGVPQEVTLRTDLPVLFLVAESDAPRLGEPLGALWGRVVEARAPWTLTYASRMPHAFDAFEDSDEARRLVQQTIAFWKSWLEPMPEMPWERSEARAIVASAYGSDVTRTAELLGRWVEVNPDDSEAIRQYARTLVQLQRYDEAGPLYERAYALDPTHPGVLSGLGQMRIGQQRWEEAADLLSRAIASGVQHSMIYGQLGWAQLHLGRNAEAARSYERAFELGIPPGRSTRGIAWYNLACAYARLGERDRAFAALEQAVAEGMNDRAAFERDEDLAPLRSDPRFAALFARAGG